MPASLWQVLTGVGKNEFLDRSLVIGILISATCQISGDLTISTNEKSRVLLCAAICNTGEVVTGTSRRNIGTLTLHAQVGKPVVGIGRRPSVNAKSVCGEDVSTVFAFKIFV